MTISPLAKKLKIKPGDHIPRLLDRDVPAAREGERAKSCPVCGAEPAHRPLPSSSGILVMQGKVDRNELVA